MSGMAGANILGLVAAMALLIRVGVLASRSRTGLLQQEMAEKEVRMHSSRLILMELQGNQQQGRTWVVMEEKAGGEGLRSKGLGGEIHDGGAGSEAGDENEGRLDHDSGSRGSVEQGNWALVDAAGKEAGDDGGLDTSSSRGSKSMDVVKVEGGKLKGWAIAAGVLVVVAGVGVIMMVFPVVLVCVVRMLGFTAQGIVAGSRAAFIMSLYAGRVTVGSICAICQSIGALGVASVAAICACGPLIAIIAIIVLTVGLLCYFLHAHPDFFSHLWNSIRHFGGSILDHLRSL